MEELYNIFKIHEITSHVLYTNNCISNHKKKSTTNGIDLVLLLRERIFDSNSVVKSTTSKSIRFNAFSLNHACAFTYILEGLNECISIISSISMDEETFEFYVRNVLEYHPLLSPTISKSSLFSLYQR